MSQTFEQITMFPTFVYSINKPEYITSVKSVSMEMLTKANFNNPLYPVKMTDTIHEDSRIFEFAQFTAVSAGNLLTEQGYNTFGKGAYFESMWCQEHHKMSSMEYHTHPNVLMVGFYFLDVPENSSVLIFHDPRPAKVATPLEEENNNILTYASNGFQIIPEPGLMVLTNSWLPHSISRHGNDTPLRFIHFNIGLTEHIEQNNVEII